MKPGTNPWYRSFSAGTPVVVALIASACSTDAAVSPSSSAAFGRAGYDEPGMHRQYGNPTKLGNGKARTYVVLDAKSGNTAVELGVALDEKALDGLPDAGEHSLVLPLPQKSPAPYQFVELDWNPRGHPPMGVYNVPHFDFHFYTISQSEWNTIVPSDPNYAAYASNLPTGAYVMPWYIVPGPPAVVAVPKMGVHWLDRRSPELQKITSADYRPFTKTFIYGSWNGRFTFYEPMITLAYLLSQPSDVVTPIPVPAKYPLTGYFPTDYRVTYDAQAKEYRIALTSLMARSADTP